MYVDIWEDREQELIRVVERVAGERIYKEYRYDHSFYYRDPKGEHKDIFGNPVKKITPSSLKEKNEGITMFSRLGTCESDIKPTNRCLEQNYLNANIPKLNVAFWDIETDFDKDTGYSAPEDANNPIISIAVYLQWMEKIVCLALPPAAMRREEAENIAAEVGNTIICTSEREMLEMFVALVQDADVISGWNSESYDITYTMNRIIRLLGKNETRKLCLWNQLPRRKNIEIGTGVTQTYELTGRIHLDYLQLYKKYNYEERSSYSLNAIAEIELGEKKVEYEGTLDQLYNQDFKLFLEYNIQDTMLLHRLDKKLQFIDLANSIAHTNVVPIPTVMGAVAVTEQAIIVEAHKRGMVVPDRKSHHGSDTRAAGGWVAHPKRGLHHWIGSADLNSLYPSVIRAFNMSPETIVGQIRYHNTNPAIDNFVEAAAPNTFAGWWNDRFNTLEMQKVLDGNNFETLYLDMEDGNTYEVTGAEVKQLVFNSGQPWMISANGTIFKCDDEGIIPSLLSRWYSERKQLQRQMREYGTLINSEKNDKALFVSEDIVKQLTSVSVEKADPYNIDEAYKQEYVKAVLDDPEQLSEQLSRYNLTVNPDGMIVYHSKEELDEIIGFWDKRQLVKKINLNSLYGGLLNEHCRFFDQRLGQSTTLSGRSITRHMAAKINEIFTGEYDHTGECVIYGDTDSTYFSAYPALKPVIDSGELEWNKETVTRLYDRVAEQMNQTFPDFLLETFNVPTERSQGVIAAGREVIGSTGLFIKKKRYAILVYDNEGKREDVGGKPGKIKAMGLDLRRADCPKFVQQFLMEILLNVLTGHTEDQIIKKIREFKEEFVALPPWQKGIPKAVNGMTRYKVRLEEEMSKKARGEERTKGFTIPGHVQGSMNWNYLRSLNNDLYTMPIVDGTKIVVCYLKETADNKFHSISYPIDEPHLPKWFTSLPFDDDLMLEKIVDQKIKNLLNVLKWDLSRTSKDAAHFENLFQF